MLTFASSKQSITIKKHTTMTTIKNLYDLADVINAAEDYPVAEVNAAIEANGWTDTSDKSDYDICTDGDNSLVLDENTGEAKVVDNRRQ